MIDLDPAAFGRIESQTSPKDKRALLALHRASAQEWGDFNYLEIGSHLGGSLQVLISDPSCRSIISIDPRPSISKDERGDYAYGDDNSTERMRRLLADIPGADMNKLTTIDASTWEIAPDSIPTAPHWCFIDGEHTNRATIRDALWCETVISNPGIITFHDRYVVESAIAHFIALTDGFAYPLGDSVFAVEIGGRNIYARLIAMGIVKAPRLWNVANQTNAMSLLVGNQSRVGRIIRHVLPQQVRRNLVT